jgi:citrate lyase subunit beta/citryl-CoA lyase
MFRSLLFIPGNNPSMIQNADVFMADAVIFDLEDSVSINEKVNARNLVKNYLDTSNTLPKKVILRVNPIDTEFFSTDLDLLKTKKIDYLLIPKANILTLTELTFVLSDFEMENQLNSTKLIILIETAQGINEVNDLAEFSRVEALFLGAEDLANDLGIKRNEDNHEILYSRSRVIFSAVANQIVPIDTPYTSIDNYEGLLADCLQAKSLGMQAKACIHPNQLEIINEVFSPEKSEIDWALKVIELSISLPEKGAFKFDGKMIDKPVIERAKKILEKAKMYKLL